MEIESIFVICVKTINKHIIFLEFSLDFHLIFRTSPTHCFEICDKAEIQIREHNVGVIVCLKI